MTDRCNGGAGRAWAAGLALGVLADRVVGDPARGHPVAGFGRLAGRLERRLWRPSRWAGAGYVIVSVGGSAAVAGVVDRVAARRPVARAALTAAVTWAALGGRSLEETGAEIGSLVAAGRLDEARSALPSLVGRDPTDLSSPEVCRAVVESVAENTADAVVGSLLWAAVAGPAGAVAYRAANTLDAMVGHRNQRYEQFGWAAARLDDVLTWPAARLAALLTGMLAPLAGGRPGPALRTLWRDGGKHPSPNAGRLEAAYAGALGIRLGGRNRYPGRDEHRPELGDGRAPNAADVLRSTQLSRATGMVAGAVLAAARWWRR